MNGRKIGMNGKKNWDEWEEKLQEIAPLLLWLDQLD